MVPSSENILESVKDILKEEGVSVDERLNDPIYLLNEFIKPGLRSSKDTLSALYSFQTRDRNGLVGKFKSLIQMKMVNISISAMERQSMKQQKFNELTTKAIEILIEENMHMKAKLEKISK
jgi:hypothetical protein